MFEKGVDMLESFLINLGILWIEGDADFVCFVRLVCGVGLDEGV